MIDMTIKLGPSTNHITNLFTTELHVCKQQHNYLENKKFFELKSKEYRDGIKRKETR